MTTEEYFDNTKKFIEEVIRNDVKSGSERPESIYMDRALKHLKNLFTKTNGKRGGFIWKPQDLNSLNAMWMEMKPSVETVITNAIRKYRKRKLITEINSISGEAMVSAAMTEAGLEYHYIPQIYRAKIEVRISQKNKVIFYISYKKIGEELPKAVSAVKTMKEMIENLGPNTSIQKAYSFESW